MVILDTPLSIRSGKNGSSYSCIVSVSFKNCSAKSVLDRPISFICSHLNSLCWPIGHFALPNFRHLFILWTCLLWLMGRRLGLGVL